MLLIMLVCGLFYRVLICHWKYVPLVDAFDTKYICEQLCSPITGEDFLLTSAYVVVINLLFLPATR